MLGGLVKEMDPGGYDSILYCSLSQQQQYAEILVGVGRAHTVRTSTATYHSRVYN